MLKSNPTMAQQVARAATAFQQQSTGHAAKSVTVVLSEDTLVVTLHGALTLAEKALSQSLAGAAQVQEYHRQLFADSCELLETRDRENHRRGCVRSVGGHRDQDRQCGAGLHVRHHGASVPAGPQRTGGHWSGNGQGDTS